MNCRRSSAWCMWLTFAVGCTRATTPSAYSSPPPAQSLSVSNASGLTARVANEYADPSLWLSVPDEASGQDSVLVLLPEHVTVRRRGTSEAEHLYLWRPELSGLRPNWRKVRNVLQYETEFAPGIHFLAQVSAEPDGVLYHYEFVNRSDVDFDSVQAVTDPRMISPSLTTFDSNEPMSTTCRGSACWPPTPPNASRCRSTSGYPIATASPTRGLLRKLVCRSRLMELRS